MHENLTRAHEAMKSTRSQHEIDMQRETGRLQQQIAALSKQLSERGTQASADIQSQNSKLADRVKELEAKLKEKHTRFLSEIEYEDAAPARAHSQRLSASSDADLPPAIYGSNVDAGQFDPFADVERTWSRATIGHYQSHPTRTLSLSSEYELGGLPPIAEQPSLRRLSDASDGPQEVPLERFGERFSAMDLTHPQIFHTASSEVGKRVAVDVRDSFDSALDNDSLEEVISPGGRTIDLTGS